jgi:hypothetical protein
LDVKPKVSIVIPVYNGSDFLSQAIDSALAQTYPNIEIIVVNDGSIDNGATEQVALLYGDKIRYFSKDNGGVASALNLAIREMSGDFFSWLSHDDLYCKKKISCQIDFLSQIDSGKSVIYSDYSVFTTDPKTGRQVSMKGVPSEQFRYWITTENCLHGCTLLIPRLAFEECGYFNESLRTTQDYDLWFRLAERFNFIHIAEILVKSRCHSEQGSLKMADTALKECNNLLITFVENLTLEELTTATKQPPGIAYAEIARGMQFRGFEQASLRATLLSEQYLGGGALSATGRKIRRYFDLWLHYCTIKPARHLIQPRLRLIIKDLFKHNILHTQTETKVALNADLKHKFSEIYEKNIFGGKVSRSGEGSDLVQSAVIRQELPRLINRLAVKSFLDAPCGDWCWMKETDLKVERYIGVDIVDALIEKNQSLFGNASINFICLDLAEGNVPQVDLIFSRDCLVHLTFEHALRIISNFKHSGSTYLLTTTFTNLRENSNLVGKDSFWRPLNMQLYPFNFPEPLLLINEKCTEEKGQFTDKCLGLWLLKDITLPNRK